MTQVLKVLHGSESLPLRIGALLLPCYILEDGTAVFAKNGFQKALGYDGKSEDWLYDFLGSINKFYPIPGVLFEAYEQPILFEITHSDGSASLLSGIIPETLEMTCITIVNAKNDGYLSVGQLKHAKLAALILNYALDNNLHHDIDRATGFVFLKETGKKFLQQYLIEHSSEQSYQWTVTLPDAFFVKILALHQLNWIDLRTNPVEVGKIVHEVIYSRIPDSLLDTLRDERPKRVYKVKNKTNDNQHPELKIYTAEIISLLKAAADSWPIFIQLLNRIHPKNAIAELRFTALEKPIQEPPALSLLDENLKKGVQLSKTYRTHK